MSYVQLLYHGSRSIFLSLAFFLSALTVFGQHTLSIQYADKPIEAEKVIKSIKFKKHYKNTAFIERDLQKLIIRLQNNGFNSASLVVKRNLF